MSEYIERGSLKEKAEIIRKKMLTEKHEPLTIDIMNDFADLLDQYAKDIPAADVEPVVRCQKCKSWDKEKMFDGKCWCNDVSDHTESTFFCAHGKER